ncbi:hypothetical protein FACS1894166_01630 [Bacilli bacterium]|nr:hypothetical protein FACS1894166_01630 [Bacilli bacterium]
MPNPSSTDPDAQAMAEAFFKIIANGNTQGFQTDPTLVSDIQILSTSS